MNECMERLKNGIITENPVFIMALGLCPTFAVTTNATNAIGMGLSSMAVLMFSNLLISAISKLDVYKRQLSVSVRDLEKNYSALNVSFELWKGESDAQPFIPGLLKELEESGVARMSEGALVAVSYTHLDVYKRQDMFRLKNCG